ncbi:MAG TPA: transglycosylase SLT domain-containing protein [Nitrospirota bacterium]|nr:transglycosylase SLT domain-containing protein [Nitrospirota bacterium]
MIRHAKLTFVVAAFLSFTCRYALADIYQYTDKDGVIHFSNVGTGPAKKVKRVKSEPTEEQQASRASSSRTKAAAPRPSLDAPAAYYDAINNACSRHGVDPALVHAIVKVESDFNPYALSRKGAMGLMQLMPQTAIDLNVQNIFNPHENVDGGVRYLRYLIDQYEGNLTLALAAYNAGETAVKKWGTVPPFPETRSYVQRIMKLYSGTGVTAAPRYTIYVGYGDDGAVFLTDDPSKQHGSKTKFRTPKEL